MKKPASKQLKNDNAAEPSNKEATVDAEAQHDAEQQVAEAHAEALKQATSNDSLEAKAENDSTASQSETAEPKPQERKKVSSHVYSTCREWDKRDSKFALSSYHSASRPVEIGNPISLCWGPAGKVDEN